MTHASRRYPLAMATYHVTTFGCQMNEHDSERMKGMLESLGYQEAAERSTADLILFNTCSIRESADNRFIAHLGEAKRLKSEDPKRVVGVGGCWAQSVKDEVFQRFPFVDVAFGPGQIHRLAEFLTQDSLTAQGYFEFEDFSGHLPAKRARDFQAWVQISVGCNCACAYCIVPQTRGREVSRPPGELITEIESLAAEGVREVTLLGQNVNSYGRDLPKQGRTTFAELLARVDAIEGIQRIRYTSPHPKDIREDVIRAHAELPALCEHIHLPLQSGSSRILKSMRRTYDRERYLDRVAQIRERVPDCALTTDIIVGFPGETAGRLRRDPGGHGVGRLRRRLHVHLLPASRNRGGDDGWPGSPSGEAGTDGAPGRAGPAPRPRACPTLRGANDGGAGRGAEQERPGEAPRPHRPQQDRQLRRHGRARRAGRGRDHRSDVDHPVRTRVAERQAPVRECMLRPGPGDSTLLKVLAIFGPTGVGKTAVAVAVAEILRGRGEEVVAVSCDAIQVYRGLETLAGTATPGSARGSSTGWSASSR